MVKNKNTVQDKELAVIHMNIEDAKLGICEKCGNENLVYRDMLADTKVMRYNCNACGRIESFNEDGTRKEISIWERFT